jgi:hypothetical protein
MTSRTTAKDIECALGPEPALFATRVSPTLGVHVDGPSLCARHMSSEIVDLAERFITVTVGRIGQQ